MSFSIGSSIVNIRQDVHGILKVSVLMPTVHILCYDPTSLFMTMDLHLDGYENPWIIDIFEL